MRFVRIFFFPALAALPLLLCGCVYFNTFYNAQKAYDQAISMREKRLAKNPLDTVTVSPDEKLKFERAITKCSKLLELYPDRLDYAPRALFLMGESYLLMEDYGMAVEQYDELMHYYPKAPQNPVAEVHRAKALYLNKQVIKARVAVETILKRSPTGDILREALLLAARMEIEGDSASAGLSYYEKLLKEKDLSRETRADVHWEAARLAFKMGQWELARSHALAPEYKILPDRLRYRNENLALLCLFNEKQYAREIEEARHLYKQKGYTPFRPELKLLMAKAGDQLGDWKSAEGLYRQVPGMPPRTGVAAEAFYRLGDHFLLVLRKEDSARVYYDSAAAVGQSFDYGAMGAAKSKALSRIADLRKSKPDSTAPQYQNFIIAELFLFNLSQVDSALARLDGIVQNPKADSTYTVRAAYARAYIQEEFKKDTVKSDSFYRYVLEKFPNTEWAKQAEKNLGLKPTVLTDEDKAHALFLTAEGLRFGGEDIQTKVIPAYRQVYIHYPHTHFAAQSLFVMAFLRESQTRMSPPVKNSLDSAKVAYHFLRTKYAATVYGKIAAEKMAKVSGLPLDAVSKTPDSTVSSQPAVATDTATTVAPDSTEETGRRKEVLEPKYENVDQY